MDKQQIQKTMILNQSKRQDKSKMQPIMVTKQFNFNGLDNCAAAT